jgi:hypothetical protein
MAPPVPPTTCRLFPFPLEKQVATLQDVHCGTWMCDGRFGAYLAFIDMLFAEINSDGMGDVNSRA